MKKEGDYIGKFFCIMLMLFVAFVVLKCCKVIEWSWLWVTSPLWLLCGVFVIIVVLYFIIIANNWDKSDDEKR